MKKRKKPGRIVLFMTLLMGIMLVTSTAVFAGEKCGQSQDTQTRGTVEAPKCKCSGVMVLDPAYESETAHKWVCNSKKHNTKYHGPKQKYENHSGGEANCTDKPVCEVCGKGYGAAHGHAMTPVAAKDPTCTEDGNIAHHACSRCNVNFNDENGTLALEDDDIVIPAKHDMTYVEAKDPTCTEDGNIAHHACSRCKGTFRDFEGTEAVNDIVIPASHSLTYNDAKAPTCTVDGNIAHYSCDRCNKNFEEKDGAGELNSIIDPATGHVMVPTDAIAPKCEAPGNDAYWQCTKCDNYFGDEIGNIAIEEDSWILGAIGHKYGGWTKLDAKQHQRVCEHDNGHVEKANHAWNNGKVTKKATEKQTGVKTYECLMCKATRTETIPKLTPAKKPATTKISGILTLRAIPTGKTSMTYKWAKINGVDGYDIFFALCNHGGKELSCKKVNDINGNNTFSWTKTGLKEGISYKAYVKAYVMKNGKKSYVRTSPVMHAITGGHNKNFTNAKSVTVKKAKVTLKKGKSFKIKADVKKLKKSKKLLSKGHTVKLRYMTTDGKIATVSSSGKIVAKGKGTCSIIVYAHNGLSKTIKVTVK